MNTWFLFKAFSPISLYIYFYICVCIYVPENNLSDFDKLCNAKTLSTWV